MNLEDYKLSRAKKVDHLTRYTRISPTESWSTEWEIAYALLRWLDHQHRYWSDMRLHAHDNNLTVAEEITLSPLRVAESNEELFGEFCDVVKYLANLKLEKNPKLS